MKIYKYENRKDLSEPAPLIYLNVFQGDGSDVSGHLSDLGAPAHTLVVMGDLNWDEQLSPWAAEPLFDGDNFTGGADEYLAELAKIIGAEEETPAWRGIAGYSLAGLFALYAACRTDLFSGIVSASGSMWFPGFTEYLRENPPRIKSAYLSLGGKESKTKNPVMATVEDKTREVRTILDSSGILTKLEMNPGGHFREPALRTAKGIDWLLRNTR